MDFFAVLVRDSCAFCCSSISTKYDTIFVDYPHDCCTGFGGFGSCKALFFQKCISVSFLRLSDCAFLDYIQNVEVNKYVILVINTSCNFRKKNRVAVLLGIKLRS